MFAMSPLVSKHSDESLSFNDTSKTEKAPASRGSAMSTDSVSRAPFGEIQVWMMMTTDASYTNIVHHVKDRISGTWIEHVELT